jgi:GDPmannose 4,6-dehydratase
MKRAVIVGCNGQDGRLLFDQLAAEQYAIVGIGRDTVRRSGETPELEKVDIHDHEQVRSLLSDFQPAEIYYLAAVHSSSEAAMPSDNRKLLEASLRVHVTGLVNFLQAMAEVSGESRLFYAASSHLFTQPPTNPQTEQTPLDPISIYGITKAAGLRMCRHYRATSGVYASVGILYNHESPYRPASFVSQKIVRAAVQISRGADLRLSLADLGSVVDWGWAGDYVRAMRLILAQPAADDFIVATGQGHSVGDFVAEAFGQLGLNWRAHVQQRSDLPVRRRPTLLGDPSKLIRQTGWRPSVTFAEMIEKLIEAAKAAKPHEQHPRQDADRNSDL